MGWERPPASRQSSRSQRSRLRLRWGYPGGSPPPTAGGHRPCPSPPSRNHAAASRLRRRRQRAHIRKPWPTLPTSSGSPRRNATNCGERPDHHLQPRRLGQNVHEQSRPVGDCPARNLPDHRCRRQGAEENPPAIDNAFLLRFPSFVEFREGNSRDEGGRPWPPLVGEETRRRRWSGRRHPERRSPRTCSTASSGHPEFFEKLSSNCSSRWATRFEGGRREYVTHVDSKVVLIDSATLSRLMLDFDLGVSTVANYAVKRIDSDYFEEE